MSVQSAMGESAQLSLDKDLYVQVCDFSRRTDNFERSLLRNT